MLEQNIEIINKLGLHARSAAKLVNTASRYASRVEIEYKSQVADAKSIMSVLILAAAQGSHIIVRCSGSDEKAAMEAVTALINNMFDEDE